MAIGLLVFFFVMAIFFPKSKFVYVSMIIYMWFVYTFNIGAPDRNTYEWIYKENIQGAFEPFFTLLMAIARKNNFDYVGFRMIIATLYLLFLHLTYKNVENYKTLAMSIYLISPFPWQVSGLRFSLACAIIMYAISFLIIKKRENKIKFLLFIILATMVHYSSILFIVLLLCKTETSFKRFFLFLILAFIGTVIVLKSEILLNIVIKITKREKIITWLTGGKEKEGYPNWKGFTAELIILFGNIFFTKKSKKIIAVYDKTGEKTKIAKKIFDLNIITIMFIPFLRLNDTYARLLLVMHGINIVSYTMAAFVLQEKQLSNINNVQTWFTKPKVCFNKFALIIPLWSYFIAIYQNLPFRGTSMSVLEFLNKMKIF